MTGGMCTLAPRNTRSGSVRKKFLTKSKRPEEYTSNSFIELIYFGSMSPEVRESVSTVPRFAKPEINDGFSS